MPEATEIADAKSAPTTDLVKLHTDIMDRWKVLKGAWATIHAEYTADYEFAQGNQWKEDVAADREANGLSTLTYNMIPSKYRYIVNNLRGATPSMKCNPISDGASANTAKVIDGILKHAQYQSDARDAYLHAVGCAVIGGIGAWRVSPVETETGDYDLAVDRILDPTKVYLDPSAIKRNLTDAKDAFVESTMSKADFARHHPDEPLPTNKQHDLFDADSVTVLEYWRINETTRKAEQFLVTADKIIKANTEYLGSVIPIALVTGEEVVINGERHFKGIVRNIKDMQILLNLSKSKTADYIQRTSNQQWLVEVDQIADHKDIWLDANVNGAPVLPYKATAAGKPDRLEPPSPPTGFMQVSAEADADIRASVGIRDPLEEMPSNVASKTVEMQVSQSNIGTAEFADSLDAAIKHTGRICLDLIPHYFSYPHIRQIMGLDEQVNSVPVNQSYIENGQQVMHDLTRGRYMVTLSKGPSYESRRSEASDKLMECVKLYPEFMQLAGDIVFRNMDFDGASEIADRLRAQIPPQVLAASNPTNGDGSNNPQVQQNQIAQLQQQLQQMQGENQQLHGFLQQAKQEKDTQSARISEETQAQIALENLKHEHAIALKQLDIQAAQLKLQIAEASKQTIVDKQQAGENHRQLIDAHTDIFVKELEHNITPVVPTTIPGA